jgi:hypothetical protein
MRRFVYILAIPAVVCAILLLNLVAFKVGIGTAHACGSYKINGSTTVVSEGNNATISFSLWYNSCNQQNFTSANITSGSEGGLIAIVCRNSGPDGGRLCASNTNCPSQGICNSPGVYSPNNTSYAEILTPTVVVYTSSF